MCAEVRLRMTKQPRLISICTTLGDSKGYLMLHLWVLHGRSEVSPWLSLCGSSYSMIVPIVPWLFLYRYYEWISNYAHAYLYSTIYVDDCPGSPNIVYCFSHAYPVVIQLFWLPQSCLMVSHGWFQLSYSCLMFASIVTSFSQLLSILQIALK